MNPQFAQPKGSTSKETNKDSIARKFGCKKSEVVYAKAGQSLSGYKVIYDKVSQRAYALPSNIGAVTVTSLVDGILTHSGGTVDLGALAVLREEYVILIENFTSGFTIRVKNEVVSDGVNLYRWDGSLPKTVNAGDTPGSTGGIGLGAWRSVGDTSLRTSLSSHTVPGASLVSLPNGTVNDAIKYVTPEMFRLDTDTNDDQMFQRMWDFAIPANANIIGDGEYHLANTYEVPEVHTPPVRYDFNMMTIKLRKVVYTSASGVAFINRSPGCVFEIGELAGKIFEIAEDAGTLDSVVIDETIGFQLMGQGRIPNVIHVVHGFATNVKLDTCFTRAIYVGECYDSLRGVRCVVSNANRIFGKIGGGFSNAEIDPSTCEVGITFDTSSNTNEVYANIEYCRRTVNSRPFVDDGSTNSFFGYIESCNLPGLVNGPYARYQIKNGGNNTRSQFGFEVGGMQSQIEMLDDAVDNGVPVTVGNSTITFKNLQSALSKSSQAEVIGKGSREIIAQGKVNQYIVSSNDLLSPQWNLAVAGAAQTSDLSITSGLLNGGASTQYRYGSRIVANREATESDYYVISQNVTAAFLREVSFGIALRMVEEVGYPGDADFMLKIQAITGNILYSKAFRLTGGSKIVEHFHSIPTQFVDSDTYSVQLHIRTWKMSKIDIFNIHLCNGANIERAPAGVGTGPTPFQPIDKNAIGFLPERICKPISAPLTLKQYDFDTYIVEGTGNITLNAGYDGQTVTFIRNGATDFNLLSTETIDGAGLTPMTDGMKITIQFIEQLGRWVTLSKVS
ncbi:hypothetical protein Maynard_41 [Salmonella phage Maynard]|uniref:Tail spike TSP1/Gp66 N-terminal domain-containing protein n=1 Tax=Salmonella phage Maynard TaxID=1406795 RepID=U5PYZ7_9CAUD|nr:tail protein [Salmonella phage Maynard]AGY47763.1 hypothetical protein Maynard_41 [Salmonella phage Maynard]